MTYFKVLFQAIGADILRRKEPELLSLCPSLHQHPLTLHVSWIPILGLGMEIIFFIAAPVVVCFGLMSKEVLIKYQCFSYCWIWLVIAPRVLCFSLCPQARGLVYGWAGCSERTQPGQQNHPGQRDIPAHIKSCLATKFSRAPITPRLALVCLWDVMWGCFVPPAFFPPLFILPYETVFIFNYDFFACLILYPRIRWVRMSKRLVWA